jgi:steroid 5-alpha reductase family enzyme
MAELLALAALVIGLLMLVTWVISIVVNDVSIVDIVWGLGFVLATWTGYVSTVVDTATERALLVLALVTIWGTRLTVYLARRNLGKGEDRRYQQMRKKSPDSFWITSLYRVFGLQAVLMWVVAVPAIVSQASDSPLFWLDYVGAGIWLFGFIFEAVGDFSWRARPDPTRRAKS